MEVFLRVDINIVAIVLVLIVLFVANKRLDRSERLNKIFLITCFVVILELFFETSTCILNHRPEQWAAPVSTIFHIFLFAIAPILTYFWYYLICSWIVPFEKISKNKQRILLIPVAANFILTLLSLQYGFVFFIDGTNTYHRGSLFMLSMVVVYIYFILAFILIIKQRNRIVRAEYIPLLIFSILPVIGGIFQAFFYGVLLMWSGAGFSLVIVYIFLQQRMIQIDDLTGAWTRGSFEHCIEQRTNKKYESTFGLVFIDIDGLKMINDKYGHLEGDHVLKTAVQLLKKVLDNTDVIVRIGGDEFLIILDCSTKEELNGVVEKIKAAFQQYNVSSEKEYLLECSIGAELYCADDFDDMNQFMHYVDGLMYAEKKAKKAAKSE